MHSRRTTWRRPTPGQLQAGLELGHPRPNRSALPALPANLEARRFIAAAAEAQLCRLRPDLTIEQLDFTAIAGRIAVEVVRQLAQRGLIADIRPGSEFE